MKQHNILFVGTTYRYSKKGPSFYKERRPASILRNKEEQSRMINALGNDIVALSATVITSVLLYNYTI